MTNKRLRQRERVSTLKYKANTKRNWHDTINLLPEPINLKKETHYQYEADLRSPVLISLFNVKPLLLIP